MSNDHFTNTTIYGTLILSDSITLTNAYYIPSVNVNLIYVIQLTYASDCFLSFHIDNVFILQNSSPKMIGLANRCGYFYVLNAQTLPCKPFIASSYHASSSLNNNSNLWHLRLGNVYASVYKCISVHFPFIPFNKTGPCYICHFSKQKRLPYHVSTSTSAHIFELIHASIWGPYSIPSIDGHKYFFTLVDDYIRFTRVILMKSKSETRKHLCTFISLI